MKNEKLTFDEVYEIIRALDQRIDQLENEIKYGKENNNEEYVKHYYDALYYAKSAHKKIMEYEYTTK